MSAVKQLQLISVDDYLAGELVSPVKHEYLGGFVYAMAGAKNSHNRIAVNILGRLHALLRGQRCQPCNSDTKVRVRSATHTRFYYPDTSVVCQENPRGDSYQDNPVVIFEVLSKGTRRADEGEKKDAYLSIPTLRAYVLVEQETATIVVYRRGDQGFASEVHEGMDAVLPLPEIEVELPLREMYEGVEFAPEPEE